ncbi:alkene reductase [Neorhodopirellula lusitana]|uniref:alkene reductase n=1 Tax=Neorhodopirellula lusitana TaxID=445327 RepID=UPI00384EF951
MPSTNPLLQPYTLGDLQLPNRIAMAPMTRARAGEEMLANDLMAKYYCQRSSAGLIITEGTFPSQMGVGWMHAPGIYTDAMQAAWKPVVDSIHEAGGRVFCQLWHTGRASHSDFHDGQLPLAPSAVKHEGAPLRTPKSNGGKVPHETPHALTTDEISNVIDEYQQAAERAMQAGFDGVEIHAANGYLIDTFLQSKTNHRDDQYGGSTEKRFEFLREVTAAVTSVFPSQRVGVRISPHGDFNDMGSPDFREQFLYVAEQLDSFDLAYLHILIGTAFGFHELGEPLTMHDFRKVYSGTLMANAGFDRETGAATIADGGSDLVSYGRPYISNPDLVERFANDWPLADDAPRDVWYSFDEKGYADWPTYQERVPATS